MQLLELVLRFLPLRDKLLRLRHLSSAFPSLTPACFTEDGLTLRRSATRALTRSADLLSLLSRVRQLSVYAVRWSRQERVRAPELEHCAWLSFSVAGFSRLQSLSVCLLDDRDWYAEDKSVLGLQHVLAPLSSLPQLRSLRIDVKPAVRSHFRFVPLSNLALLSDLRALRSLALSLLLPVGSLSLLCSLPLEHLDLSQACLDSRELRIAQVQPPDVAASRPLPVSFSLRLLQVPLLPTAEATEEVKRVLAAYGIDRHGRAGEAVQPAQLEFVHLRYNHEQLLESLWGIPSLTALPLTVSLGTRLSPQPASASAGPLLPQLRCVSLHIRSPDQSGYSSAPKADRKVEARRRRNRLAEVAAECVGFLRAYSGQLLRLAVTDVPNLPAAAPIMQAAFRCQQLRRLDLDGGDVHHTNSFAAVSFALLPQLHTLSLRSIGLSTAELASLLRACPAVEHIELYSMPAFTLELLPDIGRSCRRLRHLEAWWCKVDLFAQPVEAQLTAAEAALHADVVFPKLVALQVGLSSYQPPALAPEGCPMLQWLLRLLQSAPVLRFLRLYLAVELSELPLFAPLTALRGLRLLEDWQPWQQRFFHSSHPYPRPVLDVHQWHSWQPEHEADRELDLAFTFREVRALFHDDVVRSGGRTGREAFFAAVDRRLAAEVEEVELVRQEDWSCDEEDVKEERPRDERDWESFEDDELDEQQQQAGRSDRIGWAGSAQDRKRQRVHRS